MSDRIEVLLKLYEEHASHAKLHEEQREKMTGFLLVALGVVVTFITTVKSDSNTIAASILLVAIGVYGWLFSLKHYERNRLHTTILGELLKEIDEELANPKSRVPRVKIGEIDRRARKKHFETFAITPGPGSSDRQTFVPFDDPRTLADPVGCLLLNSRLHGYWAKLSLLSALIGFIFFIMTIGGFGLEAPAKPAQVPVAQPPAGRR